MLSLVQLEKCCKILTFQAYMPFFARCAAIAHFVTILKELVVQRLYAMKIWTLIAQIKKFIFLCCIKCKKNVSDVSLPNTSLYFVHKCNTRSELHFFISTGFICTLADSANCSNGDVAAVEDWFFFLFRMSYCKKEKKIEIWKKILYFVFVKTKIRPFFITLKPDLLCSSNHRNTTSIGIKIVQESRKQTNYHRKV